MRGELLSDKIFLSSLSVFLGNEVVLPSAFAICTVTNDSAIIAKKLTIRFIGILVNGLSKTTPQTLYSTNFLLKKIYASICIIICKIDVYLCEKYYFLCGRVTT